MYVSMNRLNVPADYQSNLERAFAQSPERMKNIPGFLEFLFLAPTEGDEYIVLTKWENEQDFQNWTQSDAFKNAHAGSNPNSPVKSDLRTYAVKSHT